MRGKKAKALRRIAREATVGMPERHYLRDEKTGQIINDPKSTRGMYRRLKKYVKAVA